MRRGSAAAARLTELQHTVDCIFYVCKSISLITPAMCMMQRPTSGAQMRKAELLSRYYEGALSRPGICRPSCMLSSGVYTEPGMCTADKTSRKLTWPCTSAEEHTLVRRLCRCLATLRRPMAQLPPARLPQVRRPQQLPPAPASQLPPGRRRQLPRAAPKLRPQPAALRLRLLLQP